MTAWLDVLPVTTTSVAAREAYESAVVSLAAGRAEVRGHATRAVTEDPNLAMAWIVLAILDRFAGRMADSAEDLRRARAAADGVSEREDSVIRFFEHFGRDNAAAEAIGIAHLRAHPRDHLVVLYMHSLYNIVLNDPDRRARHASLFRSLAPSWPADDWFLQGALAFVESESGQHERALELARAADALRPDASSVAHGFAHALLETGRVEEGARWLDDWLRTWGEGSNQACHLTWHQALFSLAVGDGVDVARRLDAILGFAGTTVSALTDGASLLWRLHLDGAALGTLPWQAIADLPSPPGFAFGNLHRGIVLAGLSDVDGLRAYAGDVPPPAAAACLAIADFVGGEPASTADRLLDHESELVAIGGSRAQLEVLDDTLIAALARAGRVELARRRLADRLAARASVRDERWLARLAVA